MKLKLMTVDAAINYAQQFESNQRFKGVSTEDHRFSWIISFEFLKW